MKKQKIFNGNTVTYFAAIVTVAKDPQRKFSWSNAFAGQKRQGMVVNWDDERQTVLDNEDGAAWIKLSEGWWPNRDHRELTIEENISDLVELPEDQWNPYDREKSRAIDRVVEEFGEKNYGDDPQWQRLQSLKEIAKGKGFRS